MVTLGREMNVPTPCNRAVNDVLALYANGGRIAETGTPLRRNDDAFENRGSPGI